MGLRADGMRMELQLAGCGSSVQSKTYPRVALNNHRLRQAGRAAVSDGAEVLSAGRQAAEREADLIRARADFVFLV